MPYTLVFLCRLFLTSYFDHNGPWSVSTEGTEMKVPTLNGIELRVNPWTDHFKLQHYNASFQIFLSLTAQSMNTRM